MWIIWLWLLALALVLVLTDGMVERLAANI